MNDRLSPGTKVITKGPAGPQDWTEEAIKVREFGIEGMVIGHHDSHGLCYAVAHFMPGMMHRPSWIACYNPEELTVKERPAAWV